MGASAIAQGLPRSRRPPPRHLGADRRAARAALLARGALARARRSWVDGRLAAAAACRPSPHQRAILFVLAVTKGDGRRRPLPAFDARGQGTSPVRREAGAGCRRRVLCACVGARSGAGGHRRAAAAARRRPRRAETGSRFRFSSSRTPMNKNYSCPPGGAGRNTRQNPYGERAPTTPRPRPPTTSRPGIDRVLKLRRRQRRRRHCPPPHPPAPPRRASRPCRVHRIQPHSRRPRPSIAPQVAGRRRRCRHRRPNAKAAPVHGERRAGRRPKLAKDLSLRRAAARRPAVIRSPRGPARGQSTAWQPALCSCRYLRSRRRSCRSSFRRSRRRDTDHVIL